MCLSAYTARPSPSLGVPHRHPYPSPSLYQGTGGYQDLRTRLSVDYMSPHCCNREQAAAQNQQMTYTCPYKGCERKFARSSGLSLHLSRGHPERNFSTVLGKRKLQIEQEEERKRRSALCHGSVEAGGNGTPVTL